MRSPPKRRASGSATRLHHRLVRGGVAEPRDTGRAEPVVPSRRWCSTVVALVVGTLAAAAVWKTDFFGRNALSLFIILPIALPGIITGIALRSAISLGDFAFSFWTLVIGHATFCVAVAFSK